MNDCEIVLRFRHKLETLVLHVNLVVPGARSCQFISLKHGTGPITGQLLESALQFETTRLGAVAPVSDDLVHRAVTLADGFFEAPKKEFNWVTLILPGHEARPTLSVLGE